MCSVSSHNEAFNQKSQIGRIMLLMHKYNVCSIIQYLSPKSWREPAQVLPERLLLLLIPLGRVVYVNMTYNALLEKEFLFL